MMIGAPLKTQWVGGLEEGVLKVACSPLIKFLPLAKQ